MSENQAGSVLTSENAAEFYAQKLGLAPAEPPTEAAKAVDHAEAEPVEVEAEGSEPEAKEEAKQEEPKKANPKLERRFSDLTKQREEARKEAQAERERRAELEKRLADLEAKSQPQKAEALDEEPQPSQFQDAFEYAKALAEYTADKRIEEMKKQEADAKAAAERQKVIDSWAQRVQTVKAELPDFDEMVASSDVVVSDAIRDSILESDVGPKILYHLAENEELAKKIAGMSERAALKELGKLEARFEKTEVPEVKPVKKSNAPAPINPLRAVSGVADVKLDSDGKWYGSYSEWKAARKSGKVR
jgi:polyhydroxyalkanoate synthesis regulator phasin